MFGIIVLNHWAIGLSYPPRCALLDTRFTVAIRIRLNVAFVDIDEDEAPLRIADKKVLAANTCFTQAAERQTNGMFAPLESDALTDAQTSDMQSELD